MCSYSPPPRSGGGGKLTITTGGGVSETPIGEGGTNVWHLGGMDGRSTLAFFFEVSNTQPGSISHHKRRFTQFLTTYIHSSGRVRVRSTTCVGGWQPEVGSEKDNKDKPPAMVEELTQQAQMQLAKGFDQECAAAILARYAVLRTDTEEPADVIRWLDRSLIRLCNRFATYKKDDPASFRLTGEFTHLPQFVFHLRRSQFLQSFNCSPDETAFYRYILNRESVAMSMVMIQPSLVCYSFSGPPQPVLLDASSVRPDVILLLDTYFQVLIHHGETVAAWREQGYHLQEEHSNFRHLLEAPQLDAQELMRTRLPVPRFIVCDQHKSEARFLMAKVNPSTTHHSAGGAGGTQVFTDDVSLRVFMEHLMKLAVQQ